MPALLAALAAAAAAASAAAARPPPPPPLAAPQYDVIVYGATPGGILAALAAAGEGASVLLLHPLAAVGGMVTGGLGKTDVGDAAVIGGPAEAFFAAVGAKYGSAKPVYDFEPHVAAAVFDELLAAQAARVTLVVNVTVVSLALDGAGRITGISVAPSAALADPAAAAAAAAATTAYTGSIFIDASYEGDLLPLAGVPFAVGREAAATYNESFGGRLEVPNKLGGHQFNIPLNYTWPNGTLLPGIYAGDPGAVGAGDGKVQVRVRIVRTPTTCTPCGAGVCAQPSLPAVGSGNDRLVALLR